MKWLIRKAEGGIFEEDEFTVRFKKPIEVDLKDDPFPGYEIIKEIVVPETKNPENQVFWGNPGDTIKALYTVKRIIPPNEIVIKA